jgi:ADP-ribosylglycohydrolase
MPPISTLMPGRFAILRIIFGENHVELLGRFTHQFNKTIDRAVAIARVLQRNVSGDESPTDQEHNLYHVGHGDRLEAAID